MKTTNKQTKKDYQRFLKVIKQAEKEARRFVRANSKVDPQLKVKYI